MCSDTNVTHQLRTLLFLDQFGAKLIDQSIFSIKSFLPPLLISEKMLEKLIQYCVLGFF